MKKLNLIFLILLLVFPYNVTGFNFGNLIIMFLGIIFLFISKKIMGNRYLILIMIAYALSGIISIFFIDSSINSISGLSTYFAPFIFYLIWNNILNREDNEGETILKYIVYILGISSLVFILIQCGIKNLRVYGNVSYANTYALILLTGIYLNTIVNDRKYKNIIEVIFFIGIFATGSRTTIACLIVYITLRSFINKSINIKETILNISLSVISFILIDNYIEIVIFTLPILFIVGKWIYNKKISKFIVLIPIILSVLMLIITPNYIINRLSNISLKQGTLQERFIIFEDTIKCIVDKPMGYGINTYENTILSNQSAFYGIKYSHNSILQVGFESGVLSSIALILLFIVSLMVIFKGNKFKDGAIVFCIVFLHSLLDFDFSFVLVIALWMLVIVINEQKNNNNINISLNKYYKFVHVIFIIIILPIVFQEVVVWTSTIYNKNDKYSLSKDISRLSIFKDYRIDELYIDSCLGMYYLNKDKVDLEKAIELINENDESIKVIWNSIYIYELLDKKKEVIEGYDKLLALQPYYFEVYKNYYITLKKYYVESNENYYNEKIEELENVFYSNLKSLNSNAKYIYNQLPIEFEDVVTMEMR
ncbi:O-antigen ligase [uncultured Clostridium sp.]|uniref:O-antigen ligase family protein n=1 Tax=uncultured Clostridium sp. TaxID=59620 RepID=UPI00259A9198|nr:O-antigen ligase family protein [uncultured Clostridium sp.]